jgi:hypothetical protein
MVAGLSHECDTHAILKLNQLDPRRHTQNQIFKEPRGVDSAA